MKKCSTLLSLLLVVSLLFLLSACGGNSATPSSDEGSPAKTDSSGDSSKKPGEITRIQYYHWSDEQRPLYDELIPAFEAENPDIKVEVTVIPYADYWTKLQTSIPAGNGPDAFAMSTSRYNIYRDAGGLLENLSPYIERDGIKLDDVNETILEMYLGDGNIYGIPKDCDSVALFYNKKFFDEANEPYPTSDWTWEDCFEVAARLSKPEESKWGYCLIGSDDVGYVPYLRSHGAYYIAPDRVTPQANLPLIAEKLKIWRDLIKNEVVPPMSVVDEVGYETLFMNGQVAMHVNGSWMLKPYYDAMGPDNFDVVEIPKGDDHRDSTSGSLCYSIAATSKLKEAAWKFVSWMITDKGKEINAKYCLSPYKSQAENWAKNFPGVNAKAVADAVAYSTDPVQANDRTLVDPFEEAVSRVLTTDEDIQAILDDIQSQMEDIASRTN